MDRGKLPRWVGVVAAVVVAGCTTTAETTTTSRPDTTTSTVLVTTTTIQATTTTEASTTTTQPESYVPEPPEKLISNFNRQSVDDFDTTGDDLYQVVVDRLDLFNYLEGSPLESVDEILELLYEPSYPLLAVQERNFAELVDNNWHYADPGERLLAVSVVEVRGNEAEVLFITSRGQQIVVDSTGTEVKRYLGWEPTLAHVLVVRSARDGRWRIADVLSDATPASPEDTNRLVPVDWTGRS